MTSDAETVQKYQLDKIRFGDIVALMDHDNRFGRAYRQGAVSIGIVVHSNCLLAGHGPGVTTLMTCATPLIKPVIDPHANLADLLGIGTPVAVKIPPQSARRSRRKPKKEIHRRARGERRENQRTRCTTERTEIHGEDSKPLRTQRKPRILSAIFGHCGLSW